MSSLWTATLFSDAGLIRLHVLKAAYMLISVLAGAVAGPSFIWIWYGLAGRPSVVVQGGRYFVSARTMTGVRTLRLDDLVSVRRFTAITHGGYIDELHMRDGKQIRLIVDGDHRVRKQVRQAVLRAESRPGSVIAVTRHARTGLGLEPRSRLPEAVHRIWGSWMMMAGLVIPALVSYAVACFLVGIGI